MKPAPAPAAKPAPQTPTASVNNPAAAPVAPKRAVQVCTDASKVVFPKLLERDQVLGAIADCGERAKSLGGAISEVLSLTSSGEANLSELAAVVRQESVLSARIIKLANTAALAPGKGRVAAIEDAIRNIGSDGVRTLAVSTGVFENFSKGTADGADLLRLFEHSLAVAMVMDRIVPRSFEPAPGAAYLMGMCHDLAEMLLRQYFREQFVAAVDFASQQGLSVRQMFSRVSGTSFAEVTQLLTAAMRLPQHAAAPICEHAAWEEGGNERTMSPLAVALRIANFHANALQLTSSPCDALLGPLTQSECRSACITAAPLNTAEIRSEASMTIAMLAGGSHEPPNLLPGSKTRPRIWYARHPSFSPLDPLEEALKLVAELTVRDCLPSRESGRELDGLIVAMPRRDSGGLSVESVTRWLQAQVGKTKAVYFLDEPASTDEAGELCPIVRLPIVLSDLMQIVKSFSP
jgi:HD-like signal output (HDOD) protein